MPAQTAKNDSPCLVRWVDTCCANKEYIEVLLNDHSAAHLKFKRMLFRLLRQYEKSQTVDQVACIFEPAFHMTLGEMSLCTVLRRGSRP